MLNHFYVRLVHDDLAKRYIQCRAMHVMAAFFLLFYAFQYIFIMPTDWTKVIMVGLPTIVIFSISIFSKKQIEEASNNLIFRILEIGFLCMGAEFFYQNNKLLIAILFIIIALFIALIFWMEHRLFSKQFIDFHEETILIPGSIIDKKITWNQVKQVAINHDYLTIEYKSNSFYQHKINDSFTEDERIQFNQFCLQRIT